MRKLLFIFIATILPATVLAQRQLSKIDNLDFSFRYWTGCSAYGEIACKGEGGCSLPYNHIHKDVSLDYRHDGVYLFWNKEYGTVQSSHIEPMTVYDGLQYVSSDKPSHTGPYWHIDYGADVAYVYDELGYMTEIRAVMNKYENGSLSGKELRWTLNWNDGNLTSGILYIDGKEIGTFACTYDKETCDNAASALSTPIYMLVNYYYTNPLLLLMNGHYGNMCRNYMKSIVFDMPQEMQKECLNAGFVYVNHEYEYDFDEANYPVAVYDKQTKNRITIEWTDNKEATE